MKIQNFYQTFIKIRNSLGDSISNQNALLDELPDVVMGDRLSLSSSFYSMLSDGLTSIKFENGQNDGYIDITESITDKETDVVSTLTTTVAIDDLTMDYILPKSGLNIIEVLQDVNSSERLNYAMARINDQLLNYGHVAATYASQIIDSIKQSTMVNQPLTQLQEIILSNGETDIDGYSWSNIVSSFYQSITTKSEESQSDELHNLVLDERTHVIQSFVGTTLLSIVGTIVQVIAAIVSVAFKVIGFILSMLGNALGWLLNQIAPSNFEVNRRCANRMLDTPTAIRIFNSVSSSWRMPKNGFAVVAESPSSVTVAWRKGDSTNDSIYCNRYISLNIDPDEFQNFLLANFTVQTQTYTGNNGQVVKLETVGDFDPFNITTQLPDTCWMNQARLMEVCSDDDKIAKAICAALVYDWFRGADWYQNSSNRYECSFFIYENSSSNPSYSVTSNLSVNMTQIFGHYFMEIPVYSIYHPSFASNYHDMSQLLNDTINKINNLQAANVSSLYDQSVTIGQYAGITLDHYLTARPLAALQDSLSLMSTSYDVDGNWVGLSSGYDSWMVTCETSNFPSERLVSWPAYTSDALKNTLLFAAGVMIATGVVVGLTATFVSKRINKWKLDSASKLNNARAQYLESGSDEDYNALRKQMRSYNIKAKLFGWQTYDATNGWFNDVSSDTNSESIQNVNNNIINESNMEEVKKLIVL